TVFISLGYLYFSFTGLRQTLALSIILLSYNYIRERNLLLFIMFVFIASLFHSTALVFLLIYPISHYELGKKDLILIIVMLIVSFFLSSFIRNSIFLLGWSNNLIAYATSETSLNYS